MSTGHQLSLSKMLHVILDVEEREGLPDTFTVLSWYQMSVLVEIDLFTFITKVYSATASWCDFPEENKT